MSKIYNEIEIDMNPESSSFEEVMFEDSFEYDGDMILMQENPITTDINAFDGIDFVSDIINFNIDQVGNSNIITFSF